MADREVDPTCNPIDPLIKGGQSSSDYKPYPTQPDCCSGGPTHIQSAPPPPQQPTSEDYKTFDIVKATQYGVYERVVEIIEGGYDVNQMDKENVSLIHWAAINNRSELIKYYVSKGALVDKFGGDLNSTPLHWASRQGHLSMVVLLMSYGADPSLRDGEGCSCIHLAAQFGHTSLVAYLIAKGQDVDMQDINGMTALMWAAYRVFGPDPTRLLLTLNADVHMVDRRNNNNALHWACTSGNHVAVKLLVDAGIGIEKTNGKGETPLALAETKRSFWIVQKLKEHLATQGLDRSTGPLKRLSSNKKFRRNTMYVFPFVVIYLIGFFASLDANIWIKVLLYGGLIASGKFIVDKFFDHTYMIVAPVAIYLATKTWMYFTWFFYYWPYLNDMSIQIPFLINTALLFYNFTKAWRSDPGVIKSSREDKVKTILDLAETQSIDFDQFCSTCIVRRPLRSKHCSICNRCVARFDHHCPWIDNCVGFNNHKYFMNYLIFLLGMIAWCLWGAITFWNENTECMIAYNDDGILTTISKMAECSPWVFWIAINASFHLAWVSTLLACQIYQMVIMGVTTNERMNFPRYKKFHTNKSGVYKSPYDQGIIKNCVTLEELRCLGLCRPDKTDWLNTFELDPDSKSTFNVPRDKYQFV